MTSSWRTDPVQAGWSVELFWMRYETGTVFGYGVTGTAPATEDGKVYTFEYRLNEPFKPDSGSSAVDSYRTIFKATASISGDKFRDGHEISLDDGRSTVFDGPRQRYRIVACEMGPQPPIGRRKRIGPHIVVGEGVSTVHIGGVR
ncbi:hypothetical protein AB0J48_08915 [Nocardia salmonicida]|uniref:hypothetical protein n=1 Tax=Nocardia salmonicida TaxID=53431 RepID=UPI003449AF65